MSGNIYSSHKKGRVSPEGLLLSQARGGVGGAGGREELAEVSSPSQRKFPESRARMGSNSILPPAGEAAAGRCDEEVRASRRTRTRCEGHMGGVGDFKSLSLQSFLQAHVDSTVVTAYILTGGHSCLPAVFLRSLTCLHSYHSPANLGSPAGSASVALLSPTPCPALFYLSWS